MEQVPTRRVDAWKYVWSGAVMYANIQQMSIHFGHGLGIRMHWMNHCGNGLVQHDMPHSSLANKVTNSASIKTVLHDEKT